MKHLLKHKGAIIISLLTGIFLIYVQPILLWLGEKFVQFFIFSSEKFSNYYYQMIARDDSNSFTSINNYILTCGLLALLYIAITEVKKRKRKSLEKIRKLLSEIEEMKSEHYSTEEQTKKTKEELQNELEILEKGVKETEANLSRRDNRLIFITIIAPIFGIILLANHVMMVSVSNQNVLFQNKMEILLPYVGQDQINQFKSDWHRIKTADDFEKVISEIDKLTKKHIKD